MATKIEFPKDGKKYKTEKMASAIFEKLFPGNCIYTVIKHEDYYRVIVTNCGAYHPLAFAENGFFVVGVA